MRLNNLAIISISFFISSLLIYIFKITLNRILMYKSAKDYAIKRKSIKSGEIECKIIDLNTEISRIECPLGNNGLIIDKKLYNEKNSYFVEEGEMIYVLGKKENFAICLIEKRKEKRKI